jgi:hypothetical protein
MLLRSATVALSIVSILVNFWWANLPFYSYGLSGRSGIIYGAYTLAITFSIHPIGRLWWVLIGLQVFATLLVVVKIADLRSIVRFGVFALPALVQVLLVLFIADRFGTLRLWSMYALGLVPGILLFGAGACYAKAQ